MLELFSSGTTLLLGLDLRHDESNVIKTASSLALRTGSRLILVHAAQPFRSYALAGEGFALPYEEFERESYDADIKAAEQTLQGIRDKLPPELMVDIEIVRDYTEDALEGLAKDSKAQLILCGHRASEDSALVQGLSTSLSLMAHATVPVMTIPLGSHLNFTHKAHKILVADSLQEGGFRALKAALGFSKSIDTEMFYHLHVYPNSVEELQESAEKIRIAMVEGRIPADPSFHGDYYVEKLQEKILHELRRRHHEADPELARGPGYKAKVSFGDPAEQLHRAVAETKADILIFGKHHFLRPKGLSLGKIPYRAMLEENLATLVIPD